MGAEDWRHKFWEYLIEKLSSEDPWYEGFKPKNPTAKMRKGAIEQSSADVLGGFEGVEGVKLCFRIRNKYAQVTVTIQGDSLGINRINNYFYQLKEHEEYIKSKLTEKTDDWTSAPESHKSPKARIPTTIQHPGTDSRDWWDRCIEELRDVMDEYREIISPFIEKLVDDETTSYYVIPIQKPNGEILFKGGISYNPINRFENQHKKNFAIHPVSENWKLTLEEVIPFDTRKKAVTLEDKIKHSEIRAPRFVCANCGDTLSDELFVSHPLKFAREKGWI